MGWSTYDEIDFRRHRKSYTPHVCPPIAHPTPEQVREHAAKERERLTRYIASLEAQLAQAKAELQEWQGI